jgi:hypothetical protein
MVVVLIIIPNLRRGLQNPTSTFLWRAAGRNLRKRGHGDRLFN